MSSEFNYDDGRISVSKQIFRVPKSTYKVSEIDKVDLKRPVFLIAAPLGCMCYFLLQEYSPYLFLYEKVICVAMFTIAPIASWFIGSLFVTGMSFKDDHAVIGFTPILKKVRRILDNAIIEQSLQRDLSEGKRDES